MAADPSASHREAKLLAVRVIALARIEIDAGGPQPLDCQVLERMANGEDAQRAAGEVGALVLEQEGDGRSGDDAGEPDIDAR